MDRAGRGNQEHLAISTKGAKLPATLDLPESEVTGGIVPLHGAAFPQRDSFLFAHLALVLPEVGWAVLRYDRRPAERMVRLPHQAEDALAALDLLRSRPELEGLPVGLWGVSQGAWAAVLAAAESREVAFLVLVGFSGVSPSRQMRYATANFLQEAGYGSPEDLAEAAGLRELYEGYLRGHYDRASVQVRIDELWDRPWFELAWVPRELPDRSEMGDPGFFDFDPQAALARVRCPVLLLYGEEDQEVPVDESISAVEAAAKTEVTVCRLEDAGHTLMRGSRDEMAALHPDYETTLITWLAQQASSRTG